MKTLKYSTQIATCRVEDLSGKSTDLKLENVLLATMESQQLIRLGELKLSGTDGAGSAPFLCHPGICS